MDKAELVEAAVGKTAKTGDRLSPDVVERVTDALFGTVEYAGAIAEGLKRGQVVAVIGFGEFHLDGSRPVLRPGRALNEYVEDTVR